MAEFEDKEDDGKIEVRKQAYRHAHKGKDLKTLAKVLKKLKERKEAVEEDLKNINAEYDVLRFELVPERMDTEGVESGVRFTGIGQIVLLPDLRIQCRAAQKPGLFNWFRKENLTDLIKEDINSSTLKSFISERIKNDKDLPPSDLVRVEVITKASIRK